MRGHIRGAVVACLLTLVSSLVGVAATAPAANAAGASPCHGYVYSFYKSGSVIHMKYRISCTRKVDQIGVKPLLREGDRLSRRNQVTCHNTNVCQNEELMRDRAGSQLYTAYAIDGLAPAVNYAKDNGRGWICHVKNGMSCGGGGKRF